MSSRDTQPTAAEVREVGMILYRSGWPGARKALQPHVDGKVRWVNALRTIRVLLKEVTEDKARAARLITMHAREQLNDFGVKYGTDTRSPVGAEPVNVTKSLRFTETEWAAVEQIAEALRMRPAAYVREAVAAQVAAYKAAKAAEAAQQN